MGSVQHRWPGQWLRKHDRRERAGSGIALETSGVSFPEETPLDDVLKYVQEATAGPDGKIIPIYVDPIGLSETGKTMNSTVRLVELDGLSARASLRHCLAELDLEYVVRDGLLFITSSESIGFQSLSAPLDAFQVAGHCVLVLIAAGIGGLAAPFICDAARRRAG